MRRFLLIFLALYFDCANSSGETDVGSKKTSRKVHEKRIVCYYSTWSIYRSGEAKFSPEDIDPHLCTHVLYAFATLEKDTIVPFDPKHDIEKKGFAKFAELKKYNPSLHLLLSIGGSKEGSLRFSKLAADPLLRKQFAKNARAFIQSHDFDGLDLVWQYPAYTDGSSFLDKDNYVKLVKEIREEFKDDLCLSMAVPKWKFLIDRGFDLPRLSQYLDFMNILSYNYHEATDATVNHVAPLYPIPEDADKISNVDTTVRHYKSLKVDPIKLNLGIPLYGLTFILEDPDQTDIGSPTEDEGPGLQERGTVFFNEICVKLEEESWTITHINKSAIGPIAYRNQRWMAFDDEDMVKTKARYAINMKLGGLMFWSMDMDDFKGLHHKRAYPLISAGREVFLWTRDNSTSSRTTTKPTTTSVTPIPTRTTRPWRTTKPPTRASGPTPTAPYSSTTWTSWTQKKDTDESESTITVASSSDPALFDKFPLPAGTNSIRSSHDTNFQYFNIWITNNYHKKVE